MQSTKTAAVPNKFAWDPQARDCTQRCHLWCDQHKMLGALCNCLFHCAKSLLDAQHNNAMQGVHKGDVCTKHLGSCRQAE
eukprot:388813-Amphidinium_carterae.1